MSVIGLVNQAVAWYAASAVLAFLFAMRKPLSGAIAGIGGAVASAMLVVAGGAALLMPERIHGGMLQFLHLTIRVGGVNALWLLAGEGQRPAGQPAAGRRDLRGGGDQYRFTGGDGGDHGALRGVSHRLRRLR
ncbi:formate hydrogenlyase subunit 3 [Klebsiella pneumoniae]|nr:formate hydrogenlyase subunit 3 [Klebsiella pneumoniae]